MDWSVLWQYRGELASGFAITLGISAISVVFATLAGVFFGCLATTKSYLLRRLTGSYTELLRNLPLIVKLFFLYFVVGLPGLWAAMLALVLHQSAYIADITASGLRSVPVGQMDAGLSLGLRRGMVYLMIIIPQTIRVMLPPMTTQFVAVIKNSSLVALIGIADLTFQTQEINVQTFRGFEAATAATALYIAAALLVIGAMSWLNRRTAWGR